MGCHAPIILEKFFTVDLFATFFLLPQREMTGPHLNLDEDPGCRRYVSTYEQTLAGIRNKVTRGLQGLRWFPGPVVYSL